MNSALLLEFVNEHCGTVKIAIIPSWYNTGEERSGHFIDHQVGALKKSGLDVWIFYLNLNYRQRRIVPDMSYDIDLEAHFSKYTVTGFFPPRTFLFLFDLWCNTALIYFRKAVQDQGQPDLLHAHGYIGGYLARYLSQKFSIPYIVTGHYNGFLEVNLIPRRHRELIIRTLRDASQITAVSRALADGLKYFTTKDDISIIPNMVDTELFRPGRITKRKRFTFISIGFNEPRKNFPLLIRSFHNFRKMIHDDVRLVIVGDSDNMNDLESLISDLDLEDFIDILGVLNASEVADMISSCHLLISVSSRETFGLTLIEAMSCGVPVIAYNHGGPAEIFREGTGILINQITEEAVLNALIYGYRHYERFDPEEIRKYAIDHFSPAVYAETWKGVYHHLLKVEPADSSESR